MAFDLQRSVRFVIGFSGVAALLCGCAFLSVPEPQTSTGTPRKEIIRALTNEMEIITVNAGQPENVLSRIEIEDLPDGEVLIGMDYRIAKGVLFALGRKGVLYTINTQTGVATAVSASPIKPVLEGRTFGFDFNPVADRIRVVSNTGQNLRLHPDTGAVAAIDPVLTYAAGDPQGNHKPELVGAAYTYNLKDDKLTTNYAIDRRLGMLVTQGSVEGTTPVVSPNTGLLRTVGSLGLGPLLNASFDIADVTGAGFAAVRTTANGATRLVLINLQNGKAEALGTLGDGSPVLGMAVEP